MSIDLRVKHDLESRRRAVELFDAGVGCKPAAEALSVPRETVREWQWVYRAFGSEALLSMGGKQSRYTFEQRVAAASAVVDGGMAKTDAMAEFARNYGGMTAVEFTGKHYDMGNKLKIAEAQVELSLQHPEIGEAFRAYLKEFCKTL